MANYENNGNGFSFNGNGNGHGHNNDGHDGEIPDENYVYEEEDEDHEHEYINIAQSHSVSAYEETVHQVISLEFHDRGLTLDFSADEARELGRVLAEVVKYLESKAR
jgi:hypothetical protein